MKKILNRGILKTALSFTLSLVLTAAILPVGGLLTATAEGEKVSVTVMPVSESAKNAYNGNIPVTALGNGISFTFEIKHEGLYRVSIAKTDAAGQTLSSVSFCQSFSYSEEYNAFREEGEGAALLAEVAADGGGRVLSDPVEVFSYFVRFLPRETDPRMVFLIIAMVCLLLDVAVRKFKFKWIFTEQVIIYCHLKCRSENSPDRMNGTVSPSINLLELN